MVTDAERRALRDRLVTSLGEPAAGTLMALLAPFDWTEVARRSDVESLRAEVGHRFDALEGRFEGFQHHVDGRFEAIDGRFEAIDGRLEGVQGQLAGLRDRIDSQLAKLVAANVATVTAVTAIVAALVR